MLVVVALGGNALLRRNEPLELDVQQRNLRVAVEAVAELARTHDLVVTHGNGPQVGLLALQAAAYGANRSYPLDVLVAESEGMIGYLIEQELSALLPGRAIATLLTQVEVDPGDPAFSAPSKPIGPVYEEAAARQLAAERSWTIVRDGEGYRRAVASPAPRRIREMTAIKLLIRAGAIVICSGGGGIPVVASHGVVRGLEAVIDKDLSAALLAEEIGAAALLLLTDVAAVWTRWREPGGRPIAKASPAQLRALPFAPGSMGPKVDAACRFVERTGGFAGIGRIDQAARILEGSAGTIVRADAGPIEYRADLVT
jgi:carbamate kinase